MPFWSRRPPPHPLLPSIAAAALVAAVSADAAGAPLPVPLLPACAVVLFGLLAAWGAPRSIQLLLLGLVLLDSARALDLGQERRHGPERAAARLRGRLDAVARREEEIARALGRGSEAAAALPEVRPALARDPAALRGAFAALDALRRGPHGPLRDSPDLAIHALPFATLVWSGPSSDLGPITGVDWKRPQLFVLLGSVSTSLVSTTPISEPGGRVVGLASAELPLAVRRNIRNDYLSDFDLLAGGDPGLEIRYVDIRDRAQAPQVPQGTPTDETTRELVDARGDLLATVRALPPAPSEAEADVERPYRRGLSAAGALACLWGGPALLSHGRRRRRLGIALGVTAARGVLLLLGPPVPGPGSPLLSPGVYASAFLVPPWLAPGGPAASALSALLRSPVDLLFTTASLLAIALLFVDKMLASPPQTGSVLRVLLADLLSVPLLVGIFAWIADTQLNSSVDVEAITLLPKSPAHLVIQASALFILASGAALLLALQGLAASAEPLRRTILIRPGFWAVLAAVAAAASPRPLGGVPLILGGLLLVSAVALGATRAAWGPWLARASPGSRAGLVLALAAGVTLVLHPLLVYVEETNARLQLETDYAPLVLRQPQWREYVLSETLRRIDALQVLEKALPGPYRPGVEDMAFAVWSNTDLAGVGFSSAVEIQDPSGAVVSRFALNLPTLSAPWRLLPESEEWTLNRERLPLASVERPVVHAERRLKYHGEVHGAIHVYVGDDFWNLPFVTGRYPYSVLYRSAMVAGPARDHTVDLLAYDWNAANVFSSAERPPSLEPELVARAKQSPGGVWTTLTVDGHLDNAFVFSDAHGLYGLAYARRSPGRLLADLLQAASGMTLAAVILLLALMLLRTLLGRTTLTLGSMGSAVGQTFTLRLFVAFVALAFIPVAVLQVVVRGFVTNQLGEESERQALERAAIAHKAVEDFAFYQKDQSPEGEPVTDAVLVWFSSLIRSDLDVFQAGRLLASSKRELFASGLLAPRVPGPVYRALVLEGRPSVLRTETIGAFRYLEVSVPVKLRGAESAILSIPLALRQREVEGVLDDLDRAIRLASVLFLAAAVALAHSMARRISGPISDLTRATREIAQGNLATRVEPKSQDELRTLVESFNQMAGDLDRQRRDLERSNRLAAWAEMARQVAHEIKNPLTPIQLSAEHLRRVYQDPGVDFAKTLESCTETILQQVRTLRGIVTEFSAFARPPQENPEHFELRGLLESVVRPYEGTLPPGVSLSLSQKDGALGVRGDRRLLERAVVNLLENALQAVGDKGRIDVRARSEAGRVLVEVEDSGPGLDPEIRDRVFEPFFSTKTGGSGLGLALVKKIAEDHGGGVALQSRPGRTTAVLWLPSAEKGAASASS